MDTQRPRRVIEVGTRIIGPTMPKTKTAIGRKRSDYPRVAAAHLDVAQLLASPFRSGPPLCDELIAVVEHLFSEEEAAVARHLKLYRGRTATQVARAERRSPSEVEPILRRLAEEKRIITAAGPEGKEQYRLPPLMPGIFEMALIGQTPESMTPWHRRFAELFEALCETGYLLDYDVPVAPAVRFLPVGKAIEAHPAALPSDKLEIVLDQFDTFAVGQCQCRMSMQVVGHGCGKPIGNCAGMGEGAKRGIEKGILRAVSKKELLDLKREAESHGMVNWILNVRSTKSQWSCSCCGCCCHAMRSINEFNAPASIAPPHFRPRYEPAKCTFCGKCAKRCPMGAIAIDLEAKTYRYLRERCIGCGLCVLACNGRQALALDPVPDYEMPYRSWFSYIAHATPGVLKSSWKVWRKRS
jgi:Pyruvate/2-oxoacid:ferredoxin oxidoreductase delta subunit